MRFQKILVAIDNSLLGDSVFSTALELAHSYQAAIMLLHCLPVEMVGEAAVPKRLDTGMEAGLVNNAYPDYQIQQVLMEKRLEEAKAILARFAQEAISQGVSTQADYKVGEVGPQLCRVAQEWGADLMVVGRSEHSGLAEALFGSVSNYVVHHAPCSVLVIQESELARSQDATIDLSSVVIAPAQNQEQR